MAQRRLILASSSAARLRVLVEAGIHPDVDRSGVDEESDVFETPSRVVILANRKAMAVASCYPNALVIGCDSMLALYESPLGKPVSAREAIEHWHRLSGHSAIFYTGHCVIDTHTGRSVADVASTIFALANPSPEEIEAYVGTGEPLSTAAAHLTIV